MAKVKYDVSDVEVSDRNYVQPVPAIYTVKLVEANPRLTDGKNDIEAIVEVLDKGEYEGARIWSYVNFGEASRWKLREFTDAFGLPPKGEIDTAKLVGKKCQIKVNSGSYEGEYRARLQRWMPLSDSVDGTDDDNDDDGAESTTGDGEDYSEWDIDELKSEAEDRGILGNIPGRKTKDKLIGALEADDAGPAGNGSSAKKDTEPDDDYDEWSVEELTSEIKDRELELPKGRKTQDKLIAVLREDDNEDAF